MLGIVLMVLKITGLLLLGILGLFLVLVLLVLFVPVLYRVCADGDSRAVEKFHFCVKIFGIQVFPREKKRAGKKKGWSKRKGQHPGQEEPPADTAKTPDAQTADHREAPHAGGSAQEEEKAQASAGEKTQASAGEKVRGRQKKRPGKERADHDIRGMWELLKRELTDEGNHRALRHVLSQLRYLLRHTGPRRVQADVAFSLGDPANTGYATAALSVCPFSYGKDCRIVPDFETGDIYLEGRLLVRGHVRMIHFLLAGLRLLLDKDIRNIIHRIRK